MTASSTTILLSDRRMFRVLAAGLVVGILSATPRVTHWLQSLYPLPRDAPLAQWATMLMAAAVATLLLFVAAVAWLAPSWVVARRLRPDDPAGVSVLRTVIVAFVMQPAVHSLVLLAGGRSMSPDRYAALALAAQGVLLVIAALQRPVPRPSGNWSRTLLSAAFAFAIVLLTVRQLAWSDFNADGLEVLLLGRSLLGRVVPRFWDGGLPPVDIVMFAAAFPVDWMIVTGGMTELSARLPIVAYILGVGTAVWALAEHRSARRLSTAEGTLLLAGVAAACLAMALNASYDPYITDLASPASIDLLFLVFILTALLFAYREEALWSAAAGVLAALTRPTVPVVLGVLLIALLIIDRDWRSGRFRAAALALAAAIGVMLLHKIALATSGGGGGLLGRVRYLRFDDWHRLAWLVLPSGVVPVLTWIRWRQFDAVAQGLILVTAGYFAFFFAMAFVSLHHFLPAMVLPIAIVWRRAATRALPGSTGWHVALFGGILVAIILAFPRPTVVYRDERRLAATLTYEVGDYRGTWAGIRKALDGRWVMDTLFARGAAANPSDVRIEVPAILVHYAVQAGTPREQAEYLVQPSGRAAPAGMTLLTERGATALYVRDTLQWQQDRRSPPPGARHSPVYAIPRTTLFAHLGLAQGADVVDLRAWLSRFVGREAP